ncbi:MAG: tRNA 2-thiocytidine biosynthesis protein TtcA [Thermodesulfobacteriota bacterium]|nr:MAG: tRNA 2-thiocytidine biosynthesis protein TtcA [Thermodesulfobacteriota bacterium]
MRIYKTLKRLIGRAIWKYEMLKDGDNIIIALSGGEDSLVLTYFLAEWRRKIRINYKLLAVHLDMGFPKDEEEYKNGVEWLQKFCKDLEVDFYFDKTDFGLQAMEVDKKKTANPCFVCSWHRRKYLFRLAEKISANKIAFGHHLDDVIITFFLNMFYNGELSAILPVQEMFKGKLYLIRPLILLEKNLISRFAERNNWKVLKNYCPFSEKTKRKFMENFLKEKIFSLDPRIKKNIARAIFNPRFEYLPQKKW